MSNSSCKGDLICQLLKTSMRTSQSAQMQRELYLKMTLSEKWKVLLMDVCLSATERKMEGATCPKMKVKLQLKFLAQRISSDFSRPMGLLLVWAGSLL